MRQGIQALENRYATLQNRYNTGGFGAKRMDRIQNRLGRLENMGATGMRGPTSPASPAAGLASQFGGGMGQAQSAPMQRPSFSPQQPMQPGVNDLVAHYPAQNSAPSFNEGAQMGGQPMGLPPGAAKGLMSALAGGGATPQPPQQQSPGERFRALRDSGQLNVLNRNY